MQVVLRENVKGLGEVGDVVAVAEGYARNYLLPKRLAIKLGEANMAAVQRAQEARRQREMEELDRVKAQAEKLEGFLCYIEARATEAGRLFGSVGPEQVAQALIESGFETIRPASVDLAQHIEELGDYEVELMLHPEVRVGVTVRVAPPDEEGTQEQ